MSPAAKVRRALCVLSLSILASAVGQDDNHSLKVNVCDMCDCDTSDSWISVKCYMSAKTLPDLDKLDWPQGSDEQPISVVFDGLGLTVVQTLSGSPSIRSLNFPNNQIRLIWPSAFAKLEHLKHLSFAYNALAELTPDMFVGLSELVELDMSHNELTVFNMLDFEHLTGVSKLNLNGNKMKQVPYKALNKLKSLEYLYLSGNEIIYLDFGDAAQQAEFVDKLRVLDLSHNKLALIVKDTFQQTAKLEELDLSHNMIEQIDSNIFENCESLKRLDLSSNKIVSLNSFPDKVEYINLRNNQFTVWPTFPKDLKSLDVSENHFSNLFDENEVSFDSLQNLNVSANQLKSFYFLRPLSNLKTLDISSNYFKTVPKYLVSANVPSLENLYINANPIESLNFEGEINLNILQANGLESLKTINKDDLKIKPRKVKEDENTEPSSECVDIFISHCDGLSRVEDGAFNDIPLCYLDLSHNNFSTLPENSANWPSVKHGVNLQGNKWECSCQLQWVLDDLLDFLYERQPVLLHELRCESPRFFRGLRFVHWYKRSERAFCDEEKIRKSADYSLSESTFEDETMGQNDVLVIVLFVAIIVGGIIAAALIVYLIRGKYRHDQNVMKMMARKRQSMTDAKKLNGQSDPLNRV